MALAHLQKNRRRPLNHERTQQKRVRGMARHISSPCSCVHHLESVRNCETKTIKEAGEEGEQTQRWIMQEKDERSGSSATLGCGVRPCVVGRGFLSGRGKKLASF